MLFVKRFQGLATFKGATFMKANIAILLQVFALEWSTSELSNSNYNILNNDLGMKSWINILYHCFKMPLLLAS